MSERSGGTESSMMGSEEEGKRPEGSRVSWSPEGKRIERRLGETKRRSAGRMAHGSLCIPTSRILFLPSPSTLLPGREGGPIRLFR